MLGLAAAMSSSAVPASEPVFPVSGSDVVIRAWQQEVGAALRNTSPMDAVGGLVGAIVATSVDGRSN